MANNSGAWWLGNDQNVWYKTASGTQNAGKLLKAYDGGFDAEKLSGLGNRINNPTAESDNAKWMREQTAKYDALLAAANARPKLAQFDVMANWRTAKSAAEKYVNPLYEDKLNKFLQQQTAKKARKQQEFNLTTENIGQEKTTALGENEISRTRTAEDTANAITKVNTLEGQFQDDEGQQFDQNYRAAAEQIAASGGAQTGMGRQQTSDMVRLRNVTSQRQLDEFQGQREAKQLFKTRTFEDLMRGDQQVEQLATSKTKAAQFDLDSYLEDLAFDEVNKRDELDMWKAEQTYNKTQELDRIGTEEFLAGLVGSGRYSAEDIAYNRQVYGN
jgi:hypothetical protein